MQQSHVRLTPAGARDRSRAALLGSLAGRGCRGPLVSASSETSARIGVISWEIAGDKNVARVLGRGAKREILADLTSRSELNACAGEGGAVVTTTASLPATGTLAVGCGGRVLTDSLTRRPPTDHERRAADHEASEPSKRYHFQRVSRRRGDRMHDGTAAPAGLHDFLLDAGNRGVANP